MSTVSSSPIEQKFWDEWTASTAGNKGIIELVSQYSIDKFRVDFAHIPTKTAIELDGHATHSSPDAIAYDRQRQRYLEREGWHVIRFGGKEIYRNVGECVDEAHTILINRVIDIEPDVYAIGDEIAMYEDRTYFRRHPGETSYTRPYIPHESSHVSELHQRNQIIKEYPELADFSETEMFVVPTEVIVTFIQENFRTRTFHKLFVGFTKEGIKKLDGKDPLSMPANIVKNPTIQKSKQFSRKPKSRRKRR